MTHAVFQATKAPNEDDVPPPGPSVRWRPPLATGLVRAIRRWRTPRLGSYSPRSTLELPAHLTERAEIPAIDFHTHLGRWLTNDRGWMEPDVGRLMGTMDECNVACLVNLDGRWGRELEENLDRYDRAHPGRFYTFCHLDWKLLERPNGPELLVRSLERSVAAGARGLKVWKDLGLGVKVRGQQILPDNPLLDAAWDAAGAAGIPVLIHVGDPVAFFLPADRHNERLEEMRRNPSAVRHEGLAHLRRLHDALERIVASHPRTSFIGAHAIHPENLAHVSTMLGRYPNLSIDIAAVAAQLGRQPRAMQQLCLRYPDQVLFGTDSFPIQASAYRTYFRLLETDDEAFAYSDEPRPPNGPWPIYGLDLSWTVLERIYRDNAARLLDTTGPPRESSYDRCSAPSTQQRSPRGRNGTSTFSPPYSTSGPPVP